MLAAAPSRADIALAPVGGTLTSPVLVTAPPGDTRRQFILEQGGAIRLVVDGVRQTQPFLTVPPGPGEGQNVLSLAFAPDYATSGRFYVYEQRWNTTGTANVQGRVQEFSRSATDPNLADPTSKRTVLTTDVMPRALHVGGHVAFGPDGMLYVSVGDGDQQGNPDNSAQRLDTLRGKLLRVDPRLAGSASYTVPAGNPYPAGPPPYDLIYARGLRNPWRFAFDAAGGIFIGDPGLSQREEIDYAAPGSLSGANFGWNCFEGSLVFNATNSCPGAVAPVHEYGPSGPPSCGAAVIGGLVVRDPNLGALAGRYLYGDYCTGQLRSFLLCAGAATDDQPVGPSVPGLTSIGEDGQGRVYVTAQPTTGPGSAALLTSSSGASPSACSTPPPPVPLVPPAPSPPPPPPRLRMVVPNRNHRVAVDARGWFRFLVGAIPPPANGSLVITIPGFRRATGAGTSRVIARASLVRVPRRPRSFRLRLSLRGRRLLRARHRLGATAQISLRGPVGPVVRRGYRFTFVPKGGGRRP